MSETKDLAPEITADHFFGVDMRVGRITGVRDFERARNPSYKLDIDLGPLGTRQTSAQVTGYSHAELMDRKIVVCANLPPRNIAGFMSEVLVLGTMGEDGFVRLLAPDADAPLGTRVY